MIKKGFWNFRKYLDCHIHLLAIAKSLSRDVNFLPPGNVQLITNNHASMSALGVKATASGKSSNKRRSSWCSIPPKRLRSIQPPKSSNIYPWKCKCFCQLLTRTSNPRRLRCSLIRDSVTATA